MLRFNVLPTDERFQALTEEQIDLLWMAHLKFVTQTEDTGEEFEDSSFDDEVAKSSVVVAAPEPLNLKDSAKWKDV